MILDTELILRLVAIVILIGLAAFFAGSEAAFFSLDEFHLKQMKDEQGSLARVLRRLVEYPRKLIITILIGNESVNILISIMIASVYAGIFLDRATYRHLLPAGDPANWVSLISIVTTTLLLFTFGEILPKTAGVKFARGFTSLAALPLYFFFRLFYPVRFIFRILTDKILRMFGINPNEDLEGITDEDLLSLLDIGKEEGVLDLTEQTLLHNIFDFSDLRVSDVMTLSRDIFRLPLDMPLSEIIAKVKERGFSRVPMYQDDPDNIMGILSAKDLLRIETQPDSNIASFLHKPYFIPRQKPINELLKDFQNRRSHLAMVVNEFGEIAGLVTMEDVLEEIFGESRAEGQEEDKVREIGENKWEALGRINLNSFQEKLHHKLTAPEVRTLGGYLLFHFGRMPAKGDAISRDGFRFTVEEIQGMRIHRVLIEKESRQ